MADNNPAKQNMRYEVITQEDPITGDLIIPLPIPLLESMGWKEGDDIEFGLDDSGNLYLKKSK